MHFFILLPRPTPLSTRGCVNQNSKWTFLRQLKATMQLVYLVILASITLQCMATHREQDILVDCPEGMVQMMNGTGCRPCVLGAVVTHWQYVYNQEPQQQDHENEDHDPIFASAVDAHEHGHLWYTDHLAHMDENGDPSTWGDLCPERKS